MGATKYDWRSKLKEAVEPTAKPAPPPPQVIGDDKFDWGLKEATKIVEYLTDRDTKCDWTFKETINSAIALVESEEKAQREREAAEKALLDRARQKAMLIREKVIVPLLNGLRDDFAADEKKVLPHWQVLSKQSDDTFSGTVATSNHDADAETCFTIKVEAAVVELGESVDVSVVCSTADPRNTSASQLAPIFDSTAKFPTAQKFDELSTQSWLHKQLVECARICVLRKMRQALNK